MLNITKKSLCLLIAVGLLAGCKRDDEFLTEVKRDGLTVDNALITKSQFDLALNSCYRQLQFFYNSTDGWTDFSDPDWANYPSRFYRVRSQ